MSFKARRIPSGADIEPYDWKAISTPAAPSTDAAQRTRPTAAADAPDNQTRLAALERDAFAKGYAQGERAGAEAAATRGEAMLRRLAQTLEELSVLRADMIRRTERQMVQLALAIAARIVRRELTLDRGLLVAMARVALDRLAENASATIRLNPEDYAAVMAARAPSQATDRVEGGDSGAAQAVSIIADPMVSKGGCLVRSDFGFMDVTPDAQFQELARVLLEETDGPAGSTPVHVAAP